jgi:hypothetical protein
VVYYLVIYITSYSIRIVLLSRYVNIYGTMAPTSSSFQSGSVQSDNGVGGSFTESPSLAVISAVKEAAMSESHDAQMELMNVKLASMVSGGMGSGGVPGVLPPAANVGAATGFHPGHYGPPPMFHQIDPFAVQTEKARVAALNFKSILKPAPKKAAP